jgi:hypothetical protein
VGVLEEAVPDLSVYQRSEDVRSPRANPNKEGSHVAHDDHSDQALSRVGRVLANGLMVQNRVSNVRMDARACDTNLIVSAALLSTGYGSPA